MDLFSSSAEEVIKKKVTFVSDVPSISNELELVETFNLNKCLEFIKEKECSKVCLQFPDNLLQFSVRVALWLERHINQKVFVLADTSYGSCCVDELAAEHVHGDAVIHIGHTCLSLTSRLPVLHVLPRAELDVSLLTSAFTHHCSLSATGPVLVLYDVAYTHILDDIRGGLSQFEDRVVMSQLCIPGSPPQPCSTACQLHQGSPTHLTTLLGRMYCCPSPSSVVYIAHKHSQNMINFALSLRDVPLYTYTGGEMKTVDFNKTLRRRLYLVEKVKDAKRIGILVGTLSVDTYLSAIERVKQLAAYRGKRCYIFSVGKPNPAKLANFPEIEVFVMVSCPEACLDNEKEYMQAVVTLLEVELALNSNRQWDDQLSMDFRDLLEGAPYHRPLPDGHEPLAADVSLISNRIRSDLEVSDAQTSTDLSVRDSYQISVASSYSAGRSWRGLEQALGETPVAQATMGRSGIALSYEEEKVHQTT